MTTTLTEDKFYALHTIADWQLKGNERIKLPILQRSFVWKPHQIETIWDSILRGFPIGAFLMSETNLETLELLDGQQRCTSISLGFFNPWEKENAYFFDKKNSTYEHIPTVWIDLKPDKISNTHKYLIRVLTQSHPWGYQAKNNNSILTVSDRRNALKDFLKERRISYTELKNTEVYPYDANLPVPMTFILEILQTDFDGSNREELYNRICKISIDKTKLETYKNFIYSEAFDEFLMPIKNSIKCYKIPSITIKKSVLHNDADTENKKEDPTLFVRLNSQGTAIGGEELIYSIYKAEFPKSKDLVENIGASFIQPSRLISFTNRLVWSSIHSDNFPNTFSVNQFRDRLNNKDFVETLEFFIGDESSSLAKEIFEKSVAILKACDNNGLPLVLIKSLINDYSELYFFLLCWIYKNIKQITESYYISIRNKFVYLCWFSLDKDKLCKSSFWENVSNFSLWNNEEFNKIINEQTLLLKLPAISDLKKHYYNLIENNIRWNDFYPNSDDDYRKLFHNKLKDKFDDKGLEIEQYRLYWNHLANLLAWNKNILMFCQRQYFSENFSEFNSLEILVDTNRPWDYDHIYPSSWVYYKKDINPQIRDWHNMNANLRAISLEENRSESDHKSPSERLKDEDFENFFINDDWNYWNKIEGRIWDDNTAKILINAFVSRTMNMYGEIFRLFA